MTGTFPLWFRSFTSLMKERHGMCVTLRDGNAIMYRILYDRGYSPEKATSMFFFRQ